MIIVILTAAGVGAATVFGAVLGFLFSDAARRFGDAMTAFAAGVMLAASVSGLILPAIELGGRFGALYAASGIICGAIFLDYTNGFLQRFDLPGLPGGKSALSSDSRCCRVMFFVMAIAIHNLPEGLAAGVSFGTGDISRALTVAGGIALQNLPEGMVIIGPMLSAGMTGRTAFVYALFTGIIEVIGTFIGYFATGISSYLLPFALAFAGGTMLFVISDEMIPALHTEDGFGKTTYALLAGFCAMLLFDALIG